MLYVCMCIRVEALWSGRANREGGNGQRLEETVCDYFPGRIVEMYIYTYTYMYTYAICMYVY